MHPQRWKKHPTRQIHANTTTAGPTRWPLARPAVTEQGMPCTWQGVRSLDKLKPPLRACFSAGRRLETIPLSVMSLIHDAHSRGKFWTPQGWRGRHYTRNIFTKHNANQAPIRSTTSKGVENLAALESIRQMLNPEGELKYSHGAFPGLRIDQIEGGENMFQYARRRGARLSVSSFGHTMHFTFGIRYNP